MAITHGDDCAGALAQALSDFVDTGGAGQMRIFDSGSILLVSITLNVGAFNVVGREGEINGTPSGVAVASGTAASFDVLNGNGDTAYEGTAAGPGSGADLELENTATIIAGETVQIFSHRWALE